MVFGHWHWDINRHLFMREGEVVSAIIGIVLIFTGFLFCIYYDLGMFGVFAVPIMVVVLIVMIAAMVSVADHWGCLK